MTIFQCKRCGQAFEKDGLHIIAHDNTVGRVCPACIAGAETITVILVREAPGKPYDIQHVETTTHSDEKSGFYTVKGLE